VSPEPDPPTDEAERLLLSLRPDLDEAARDRIERRVLGRPARRGSHRRSFGLAAALTGGLAALVLVLALSGGAPFSSSHDAVQAEPTCETVARTVTVPQAVVVRRPDGTSTVATRPRPVTRYVQRCR
jgi:hypothetical protein